MRWSKFFCILSCLPAALFSSAPDYGLLVSARPCHDPCNKFSPIVSASFLIWQGKTWGFDFAAKSFVPNTPGAPQQNLSEKLFFPDFAWRPGFKLNLGYALPYDGWDTIANWTYYHDKLTNLKKHFDSQIGPQGLGIIPLWKYPFFNISDGNPIRYRTASANWKLFFNAVNWELGRLFFPSSALPTRLHIGAKGAWIRQHYYAKYGEGNTVSGFYINPASLVPNTFELVSSRFDFKSKQWGLGPRTGIESRWDLFYGLRLIANGAVSILYSFFHTQGRYSDEIHEPTLPLTEASMKNKEEFQELTPVVEAMLGLDWSACFWQKTVNFLFGYEWQYWWSVNHARRNYVQTLPGETFDMKGDLQMHGLTTSIRLDF